MTMYIGFRKNFPAHRIVVKCSNKVLSEKGIFVAVLPFFRNSFTAFSDKEAELNGVRREQLSQSLQKWTTTTNNTQPTN